MRETKQVSPNKESLHRHVPMIGMCLCHSPGGSYDSGHYLALEIPLVPVCTLVILRQCLRVPEPDSHLDPRGCCRRAGCHRLFPEQRTADDLYGGGICGGSRALVSLDEGRGIGGSSMNAKNYQKVLRGNAGGAATDGRAIPVAAVAAPCSSYVLEYLSDFFRITVFYYNPNIDPEEEYHKRVEEQKELIRRFPARDPIAFLEGSFERERYYESVRGLEQEPEGGARCEVCFRLRLEETARLAAERGWIILPRHCSISPLKKCRAAERHRRGTGRKYRVPYLSDFKKRGGYQWSVELSREYGLYRQDYCGCVFSRRERQKGREIRK